MSCKVQALLRRCWRHLLCHPPCWQRAQTHPRPSAPNLHLTRLDQLKTHDSMSTDTDGQQGPSGWAGALAGSIVAHLPVPSYVAEALERAFAGSSVLRCGAHAPPGRSRFGVTPPAIWEGCQCSGRSGTGPPGPRLCRRALASGAAPTAPLPRRPTCPRAAGLCWRRAPRTTATAWRALSCCATACARRRPRRWSHSRSRTASPPPCSGACSSSGWSRLMAACQTGALGPFAWLPACRRADASSQGCCARCALHGNERPAAPPAPVFLQAPAGRLAAAGGRRRRLAAGGAAGVQGGGAARAPAGRGGGGGAGRGAVCGPAVAAGVGLRDGLPAGPRLGAAHGGKPNARGPCGCMLCWGASRGCSPGRAAAPRACCPAAAAHAASASQPLPPLQASLEKLAVLFPPRVLGELLVNAAKKSGQVRGGRQGPGACRRDVLVRRSCPPSALGGRNRVATCTPAPLRPACPCRLTWRACCAPVPAAASPPATAAAPRLPPPPAAPAARLRTALQSTWRHQRQHAAARRAATEPCPMSRHLQQRRRQQPRRRRRGEGGPQAEGSPAPSARRDPSAPDRTGRSARMQQH